MISSSLLSTSSVSEVSDTSTESHRKKLKRTKKKINQWKDDKAKGILRKHYEDPHTGSSTEETTASVKVYRRLKAERRERRRHRFRSQQKRKMIDKPDRKKRKRIAETYEDSDSDFEEKPKKKRLSKTKPKFKAKPKQKVLSPHSIKRIDYDESSSKENFNRLVTIMKGKCDDQGIAVNYFTQKKISNHLSWFHHHLMMQNSDPESAMYLNAKAERDKIHGTLEYLKKYTVFKDDGMNRLMRYATKNDVRKGFIKEKICLPIEDAYEEIASAHWSNGHAKNKVLQTILQKKFGQSITHDMVSWFVKCCPVCGISDDSNKMDSKFQILKKGRQNIIHIVDDDVTFESKKSSKSINEHMTANELMNQPIMSTPIQADKLIWSYESLEDNGTLKNFSVLSTHDISSFTLEEMKMFTSSLMEEHSKSMAKNTSKQCAVPRIHSKSSRKKSKLKKLKKTKTISKQPLYAPYKPPKLGGENDGFHDSTNNLSNEEDVPIVNEAIESNLTILSPTKNSSQFQECIQEVDKLENDVDGMSTNSFSDSNIVIENDDKLDKVSNKESTNSLSGCQKLIENEGSVGFKSTGTILCITNSSQEEQKCVEEEKVGPLVKVGVPNPKINLSESTFAPSAYIPDPIKRGKDLGNKFFSNNKESNEDKCSISSEEATWSDESDTMSVLVGIANSGSICYMTSIFQMLIHASNFWKGIIDFVNTQGITSHLQKKITVGSLMYGSKMLNKSVSKDEKKYLKFDPMELIFKEQLSLFNSIKQQDCHEFLVSFLSKLEDECSSELPNLLDSFNFSESTFTKCKECGGSSWINTNSKEQILSMGLRDTPDVSTIQSMFDNQYNTLNSLEGYNCDHCKKKHMSHNATTVLNRIGDYLLIHVKRFNVEQITISNGNFRKDITQIKKDTRIIGYTEDLDIKFLKDKNPHQLDLATMTSNSTYVCRSIVCHLGNDNTKGHYIVLTRSRTNVGPRYYKIDDKRTETITKKEYEDIASRNGYMYLYSLKECKEKETRYDVFDKMHHKNEGKIFTLRRSNRKKKHKDISTYMVGNLPSKSTSKISLSKQSSSNDTTSVQSASESDFSSSPTSSHSTQGGKDSNMDLPHKNKRTNSLYNQKISTNSLSTKNNSTNSSYDLQDGNNGSDKIISPTKASSIVEKSPNLNSIEFCSICGLQTDQLITLQSPNYLFRICNMKCFSSIDVSKIRRKVNEDKDFEGFEKNKCFECNNDFEDLHHQVGSIIFCHDCILKGKCICKTCIDPDNKFTEARKNAPILKLHWMRKLQERKKYVITEEYKSNKKQSWRNFLSKRYTQHEKEVILCYKNHNYEKEKPYFSAFETLSNSVQIRSVGTLVNGERIAYDVIHYYFSLIAMRYGLSLTFYNVYVNWCDFPKSSTFKFDPDSNSDWHHVSDHRKFTTYGRISIYFNIDKQWVHVGIVKESESFYRIKYWCWNNENELLTYIGKIKKQIKKWGKENKRNIALEVSHENQDCELVQKYSDKDSGMYAMYFGFHFIHRFECDEKLTSDKIEKFRNMILLSFVVQDPFYGQFESMTVQPKKK